MNRLDLCQFSSACDVVADVHRLQRSKYFFQVGTYQEFVLFIFYADEAALESTVWFR